MKKILCLLLTFLMLSANSVFATTYTDVQAGSDLGITLDFLSRMGIIHGYDDDTFRGEGSLTRAEFAVIVARMLRFPEQIESSDVYYVDVPASHWAAGSIQQLTQKKYFSGKSDGYFGINDSVTVEEAITVFLRICKYESFAQVQGGFPTGYQKVASTTNLLNKLQVKSGVISRRDMAVLIENALNLGFYDVNTFSNSDSISYGVGDDTILSLYWDMYYTNGIVTAANGTDLYSNGGATDSITIDGYSYQVDENEDYIDYLGTYVEAYFTRDEEKQTLYFIAQSSSRNTITTIWHDDIEPVRDDYTLDYTVGEHTKTKKIANDVKVIYNGVCLYADQFRLVDILKPDYGYLELIEYGSGGVQVIKVWDFETYVVSGVDSTERFVYGKDVAGAIDFSDNNEVCFIKNRSMETIDFSKISVKNILLVAKYGSVVRAYLSEEAPDVTVDEWNLADNEITANGAVYTITPDYVDTFASKFKTNSVKIYLDVFGNIAYAEESKDGGVSFAYLVDGYKDTKNFNSSIVLKLFMQNGKMTTLYVDDKVTVDGHKHTTTTEQELALAPYRPQLIQVKINSDNEITYIDTVAQTSLENEYTLSQQIPYGTYNYKWNGSIGGKGVMGDSTVIFIVPEDGDVKTAKEDKFSVVKKASLTVDQNINIGSYKTSPKIGYEQVCLMKKNMTGTTASTKGWVVISEVSQTLNSNDEIVTKLVVYTNGAKKEVLAQPASESGITTTTFNEGDVVWLATNSDGVATAGSEVICTIDQMDAVNDIFARADFEEIEINDLQILLDAASPEWAPTSDRNSIDGERKRTLGYPYESEDGILRVAFWYGQNWSEAYEMKGTYTLVDTSRPGNMVRSCTISDIHTSDVYGKDCDKILIQVKHSSIVSVVVFR